MLYTGTTNFGMVRQFWDVQTEESINVVDYTDGVVTLGETDLGIFTYLGIIERCFDERCGFAKELKKSYCMQEDVTVKEFKFEFKGILVRVTREDKDVHKIVRRWRAALEKAEADAYEKSLRRDITEIVSKETFSFKSEEAKKLFNEWVLDYTCEGRVHSVVKFAKRWAMYMQYLVREKGETFFSIANGSYKECLIPEFEEEMFSSIGTDVCHILINTWKYGDEFKKWFNSPKRIFS